MTSTAVIERSRPTDLRSIEQWMRSDAAAGIDGSFLCNWAIIEQEHELGNVLVYRRAPRGAPIAFQVDRHLIDGIMQVRGKYRGTGVGTELARHCLADAEAKGQPLVWLQAAPETSASFWDRFGFRFSWREHKLMAYQILPAAFPRPSSASDAAVVIEFERHDRRYNPDRYPVERFALPGWIVDRQLQLSRRVGAFAKLVAPNGYLAVRILVDGQQIFHDRTSGDAAEALGVRNCRGGAFIETLRL